MDEPRDDRTEVDPAVVSPTEVDGVPVTGELSAGAQLGGFVIERVAGRGGMGVVYRAKQLRPSRTVALKVVSPEFAGDADFRSRFEHECEIAASIEHSNVIPVYEVGDAAGLLYIAMRYVEGTDLRAVITTEGRLSPARAGGILSQLAAALDAAHAHGLVHRDVKPANVLLAREGDREQVYLTDFGLAKPASSPGRTRVGTFVGTLDYAAPEQLQGQRVDARTDVYAAGCLLYEMLTGRVPFEQEHEASIIYAHMTSPPPSARALVPDLPPAIDAVIARAMAKNPDERYPSAGDLGRAAIAAVSGEWATEIERSVAVGRAAPASASAAGPAAPTTEAGPPAAARRCHRRPATRVRAPPALPVAGSRWRLAEGLALIAIVAVLVSGAFGGSGGDHPHTVTVRTTPTPTVKTYRNASLGSQLLVPGLMGAADAQGFARRLRDQRRHRPRDALRARDRARRRPRQLLAAVAVRLRARPLGVGGADGQALRGALDPGRARTEHHRRRTGAGQRHPGRPPRLLLPRPRRVHLRLHHAGRPARSGQP